MEHVSRRIAVLCFLAVAAAPTCIPGQGSGVEAAVTKVANEHLAAWNALDVGRAMALFGTPKGWFINGGSAIPSTDSLRAITTSYMEQRTASDLKWTRMQVHSIGADAAYFQGVYGGRVSFKDGRVVEWPDNATMTALLERRGGMWKITSVHWSAGASRTVPK